MKELSAKSGLNQNIINQISNIFAKYPQIKKVMLYGSRAKGNYKKGSDIDLSMLGEDLTYKIQLDVFDDLDELLLPYKIDLSVFDYLDNANLRDHIERVGVVFYEREISRLPKGWEMKRLGEVCEVIAGQSPEGKFYNKNGNGMPFYQGKKEYGEKYIGEPTTWTTKVTKEAEENDVLMSVRAPVGPINFATQKICIGRGLAAIRPNKLIDKEFLYSFLLKHESEIVGNTGAVFNSINKAQIESIKIPLPPLPEQQRIVAILDEAFLAIAKAKENAQQNLKNAKELFESYLQGVFENPKDNWEVCNLETYIKLIDYRGRTPVKTESGVRLITAKNVKLGYLQLEPQEFIANNNYESWMSRGIPNFGDVIFTTEAPLANVAQIDTLDNVAFAQRIIVMQPKPSKLNQTFLKYMLLSNPIRNKILDKGTGATVLGIKSSLLKKIEIYFPSSINEQQKIVQKLDALSTETKKLEAIYNQKINDLEELKKSILQKAFSGELANIKSNHQDNLHFINRHLN